MNEVKKTGLSRNARAGMSVLGGCITLMCTGGGIYGASSMTVVPAAERFGVDVATTGLYSSFWTIGLIIAAIIGSRVLTRFNLHGSAIIGGTLGALGLALMGFSPSLWMYYLGALLTGFPIALAGPALLQTAISRWFYKGRATVIGAIGLTEALGTTFVSFLTAKMLASSAGFTGALLIAAAVVFVGNLLVGLVFFKGVPEDYGYVPIGAEGNVYDKADASSNEVPGLTRAEAFKKPYFWCFLAAMAVLNVGYAIFYPQISSYSQFIGFSAVQAATLVSTWSWGKSLMKIFYGALGDKYGLRLALCLFAGIGTALAIAYIFANTYTFILICAFGIGILGAVTGCGTLTVSRMVGPKEFFKMALLPHAANSIGYFFGPIIFRAIYNGTLESYRTAYTFAAVTLVIYCFMLFYSLNKKHMFETKNTL